MEGASLTYNDTSDGVAVPARNVI